MYQYPFPTPLIITTIIIMGWLYPSPSPCHSLQLSSDLVLIQYVVRRALKHLLNNMRSRNSYWYLFEAQATSHPESPALVFARPTNSTAGDQDQDDAFALERYTYRELYDIVLRLSEILAHRYGVQPGDTVGIYFTNKPMFLFIWLALWNIGALPAFLNYNNVGAPLVHCVSTGALSHLFVDELCVANIKKSQDSLLEAVPGLQLVYVDETPLLKEIRDPNSIKFRQADSRRCPDATDYSAAALIYTSGTTGLPKPAIMSWRKATLGSSLYGYIVKLDSHSTVFTSMPLYHSTASMLGVCAAFNQGACVALSVKFSTSTIWTQVKLTGATHLQYVGEVCRYLLNSPLHPDERNHHLKVAYGNGLRADIWSDFKNRFGIDSIGEFYAATESPIALTSFQTGDYGIGACRNYGKLINSILQFQQTIIKMDPQDINTEYRDPQTGLCKVADVDEPGELIMNLFFAKNPHKVFQGYLGDKSATESKIIRDVFRKGDAWFRSGDLLRQDSNGLWYFVDRLGDTFRWKSENVSATEVENQLFAIEGINQVVVVGVKVPNHEGRAGFAVIELNNNERYNQQDVKDRISKTLELPRYAIPIFIKFVNHIQATDNHKIPKIKLRNQVLPKGEHGDDLIYCLKGTDYVELTDEYWQDILNGKIKL